MCPVAERLREAVRRRLAAAAEEILELLEETLSEYEEERARQRHALEHLLNTHTNKPDRDSPAGAPPLLIQHPEAPPHLLKQEQEDVTDRLCGGKTEEQEDVTDRLCGGVKMEEQVSELEAGGVFLQTEQQEALSHSVWTEDSLVLVPEPQDAPVSPVGGAVSGGASPAAGSRRRTRRIRECPLCGLRFQSTFNLETHLRVHTGERPFSCSVCGKTFNRKDSLNNHRKIHQGETFCCAVCGKRYSDKSNLRRHAITAHGNANAAHANAAHANTHANTHGHMHANTHINTHAHTHAHATGPTQAVGAYTAPQSYAHGLLTHTPSTRGARAGVRSRSDLKTI